VWECVWQYVFAGVYEFCPEEHVCYCDGYGGFFRGELEFEYWFSFRENWRKMSRERDEVGDGIMENWGKNTSQMDDLQQEMDWLKLSTLKGGRNPKNQSAEAGV
jgi:hypothetical protein